MARGRQKSDEDGDKRKPIDYSKFFSLTEEHMPTGVYPIDAITAGGPEKGDLIEFSSPSGVGKSTICCFIVRESLPKGEKNCYFDVERGVKSSMLTNMGLQDKVSDKMGDQFVMFKPQTYSQFDQMMEDAVMTHKYDNVFLDSITMLSPSKLVGKDIELMNEIGLDARIVSALLKKWKPLLREHGSKLWMVNHIRTKMVSKGKGPYKTLDVLKILQVEKL